MQIGNIFKTTAFRLTALFVVIFVVFAVSVVLFLNWHSQQAFNRELQNNIRTELFGLAEAYRAGRLPFLVRAINGRKARPDAPILLLVDRFGNNLAGNITKIEPDLLEREEPFTMKYTRTVVDLDKLEEYELQRPDRKTQRQQNNGERRSNSEDKASENSEGVNSRGVRRRSLFGFQMTQNRSIISARRYVPLSLVANADRQALEEATEVVERRARVQVFKGANNIRLLVGRDLRGEESFKNAADQALLFTVGFASLIALIGGLLFSRGVVARVDNVTQTANRIMAGDLSERMMVGGSGNEYDRLSLSLNAMLDRLEQLMKGMKEVSDNIAHDLKTPLTRMRTRIESALSAGGTDEDRTKALQTALEDADQLINTFNALLNIARLEAGNTSLEMGPVNVNTILDDVVELYEPVAEDMGAVIRTDIEPDIKVIGHRELLAQAFANLIDNALKYGSRGESADNIIEICAAHSDSGVSIVFKDNGPGVPEHERERILERFVRLEKSRTSQGNGLGLSLVRAITGMHNADIVLGNNDPGLTVTLLFDAIDEVRPK